MKKKTLSGVLGLALTVTILVGCSSNESNTATTSTTTETTTSTTTETTEGGMAVPSEIDLYIYYADSNIPVVDAAVEAMKELYPETEVIIEHRTDADGTVLKSRAAIGELPDVMELSSTIMDVFIEADYIAALDTAMTETNYFDKYYNNTFDAKQAEDGSYYALFANVPEACLVYYNKEVFANLGLEPAKNYEEFKHIVQTLAEAKITPLALFGMEKWPGLQLYDIAVVGQGQFDGISALEKGTGSITDTEFEIAAQRVEEVVSMGLVGSGSLSTNASQAFEYFETGKAGMLVNGSWYLTDAVSNGVGDNVGFFEYNPFSDEAIAEDVYGHLSGGTLSSGGMGVAKDSEYTEFCTYWTLDFLEQFSVAREKMGTPTLLVEKPEGVEIPQCIQDYSTLIENVKSTSLYGWSLTSLEVLVALENATELLVTANYPTEDFLADLEQDLLGIVD